MVRAYNGVIFGPYSAESDVIIAASAPAIATGLRKLSANKSSVTLEWTAPVANGGAYITHYNVYSDSSAGSEFTFVAETTALSFTHTNLFPSGLLLTYFITASNHVGESLPSASFSLYNAVVPAKPSQPQQVLASKTQVIVEWSEPDNGGSDITTYSVWMATDSDPTFIKVKETLDLSYSKSDCVTGETYRFKVTATNVVGTSQTSDVSADIIAALLPG
jgi:fibronectin type 3 domain-containing protein